MSVPLLADLREPPVVGRYYLVPVVHYAFFWRWGDWPVLGPLHHDRGDPINFDRLHYHLDYRFLTAPQRREFCRPNLTAIEGVAAFPLSEFSPLTDRPPIPRQPTLKRRRCYVSSWQYSPPHQPPWLPQLEARYGAPAPAIRAKGGRTLCPHRKVDLSSFPPDRDGNVTCPLHGLRVQCAGWSEMAA